MLKNILIFIVRVYQWAVSPLLAPSCRFYPSCSEYACRAIRIWGPIRGVLMAAGRVLRCHPLSPGGYDPVAEKDR